MLFPFKTSWITKPFAVIAITAAGFWSAKLHDRPRAGDSELLKLFQKSENGSPIITKAEIDARFDKTITEMNTRFDRLEVETGEIEQRLKPLLRGRGDRSTGSPHL